jgi:hypothetical protein
MIIHTRLAGQQLRGYVQDLCRHPVIWAGTGLQQFQPVPCRSGLSHHRHVGVQREYGLLRQATSLPTVPGGSSGLNIRLNIRFIIRTKGQFGYFQSKLPGYRPPHSRRHYTHRRCQICCFTGRESALLTNAPQIKPSPASMLVVEHRGEHIFDPVTLQRAVPKHAS